MIMRYKETKCIVTSLLVIIDDVYINKSREPQQIEVYVKPDGSPEYARCRRSHMIVIGCGIWLECFGEQQKSGIIRICKKAAKQYFEN